MADSHAQSTYSPRAVSAALTAFLLFCAVNAWLIFKHPLFSPAYDFPYHGWTFWTVNTMRNCDASRVNVALLGSSLMVVAMSETDASLQGKPLDLCFYRKAEYLDKRLSDTFAHRYSTMNLSAPGQIPSDAYLTLKTALAHGIKPGALIYGLAPRDFIDGTMQNAYDTEPFQYLSHVCDFQECANDLYVDPFAKLDFFLKKCFYLYKQSSDITLAFHEHAWNVMRQELSHQFGGQVMTASVKTYLPNYQVFDMWPGTMVAQPRRSDAPVDNTKEYKDRYKHPDLATYKRQMGFLERLIALCQKNDIDVVLVNMPVTQKNLDLLDPKWHDRYMKDLSQLAMRHNTAYLDECKLNQYTPSDFHDIVHLSGNGGRKFIDYLMTSLKTHPDSTAALLAAGELEKRTMAASRDSQL